MQKNMLIDPLLNMRPYMELIESIDNETTPIAIHGLSEGSIGHFAYVLNQHKNRTILIVTSDQLKAKKIFEDIKNYKDDRVEFFNGKEILLYDVEAFSQEGIYERLKVLSRLNEGENIIVVTYVEALLNKVLSKNLFNKYTTKLEYGQIITLERLTENFISQGYERVTQVEGVGQFSIRGGIVDFFPPNSKNPYRVEFFGDEIDSIRSFDIRDQRSIKREERTIIPPVKEILILEEYKECIIQGMERDLNKTIGETVLNSREKDNLREKFINYIGKLKENLSIVNTDMVVPYVPNKYLNNVIDYFDNNSIVLIDELDRIEEKVKEMEERFLMNFTNVFERGELLSQHKNIYFNYSLILDSLKNKICITSTSLLKNNPNYAPKVIINFTTKIMQPFHNKIDFLIEELNHYKYKGYKTIIFAGTEDRGKRLEEVLRGKGIEAVFVEDVYREIKSSQVFIIPFSINSGFEYTFGKLAFISDKEVFGKVKRKVSKPLKKLGEKIKTFSDLKIDDFVVHEAHGIGQYKGVEQLDIQGIKKDYLTIEYRGNDKLYLPVDQMDSIQKYIGGNGVRPKINKLSSSDWAKTKVKAKKAVEDMAKDLLELYAKREKVKGFAFDKDTPWQSQFEDAFPYEETDAQLRSIDEIKKDMEKPKPMDRLLCGDVGYGKTEVALRGAFKAITSGKQVAFLVPTTILAQQHYNTIMERFESYPINVEMLSRFKAPGEQKEIISGLKNGTVDIVIGTHRLISKDVKFQDLGLLIVDEEQRFGVKHKERLKQLKENIDILTLTATPIPRTLHMSLVGARDMSIIDEPPEERYPIQTYVVEYNDQIVRDAIIKEISRGGQVYFVYNRVGSIDKVASRLKKLVPEARIAIGHGQMSERQLENVMLSFLDGEYDVLVCTTIIETGLDIPNVNTMIVYNADKMGLSQLYQLRGRVGRSNRIAYAYLTYEKDKVLSEVAEKRLRAIKDFTEFGSGFKIAMRDLEIRGAGNLLGVEQHGHIEAIGYDLYVKYLNETVRKLKGQEKKEKIETTVDLNVDGFIPKNYIVEEEQKIEIYKKIAAIENMKDYEEMIDELIDRFGDVPKEVDNLMNISYIKHLAGESYITNIEQKGNKIILEFKSHSYITPDLVSTLSKGYGRRIIFDLSYKPIFKFIARKDIILSLRELIEEINSFINKEAVSKREQ
ncbi:MAG TPA: transcription-repair coupling factor [Tissierellales bacterium]|nr:transcription-repair coupling factor [Tissierellales bacterium]